MLALRGRGRGRGQGRGQKRDGGHDETARARRVPSQPGRVNASGRGRGTAANGNEVASTQRDQLSLANDDPLDKPEDIKKRRELYHELYRLVHGIRLEKGDTTSNYSNYQWPPLILQVVRCRYPSGVKNYDNHKEPDVVFTDESFVDLFK